MGSIFFIFTVKLNLTHVNTGLNPFKSDTHILTQKIYDLNGFKLFKIYRNIKLGSCEN